jgi:hypothetical protein
MITLFT